MTNLLLINTLILFISCNGVQTYSANTIKNITIILDTILDNYDKEARPGMGGPPLIVELDISVLGMGPVSEKDMDFSIDCYFRQYWTDSRLSFNPPNNESRVLALASKVLKDIWRPDTYIRNGKGSYLHVITMPNILLRVTEFGGVGVSQRLTIKARCPMFLKKFPMDSQACPISIGSLGYSRKDIVYRWMDIKMDSGIELSQYMVDKITKTTENITDLRAPDEELLSTLLVYFTLRRQQGYYILQIYTPCTLIVVMSWVSFWINKEASPARVALGIMTVLTMSTLGLGIRVDLPRVSYSTALDLYIVACFGFVFAALVEYAVINFAHIMYIRRTVQQMRGYTAANTVQHMRMLTAAMLGGGAAPPTTKGDEDMSCPDVVMEDNDHPDQAQLRQETHWWTECFNSIRLRCAKKQSKPSFYKKMAEKAKAKLKTDNPSIVVDQIDTISKFLFPGLYILFNGLYWFAYLYWIPDEIDSIPTIKTDFEDSHPV